MSDGKDLRLAALRRFAFAITLLNVLGHTVLGFEQAWAAPLVGIGTAYAVEIVLELIAAWQQGRQARFLAGGFTALGMVDFLLSAHITGLAVSMLLYTGERMAPIAFGVAAAITSKYVFRAPAARGAGTCHFLNPSNFGITLTLVVFSYVGITQPYMFSEKLNPTGAWLLPVVLVCAGTFLNGRFTHKLPLIAGWIGGFVAQALLRWGLFGNLPRGSLMPLTGVALLLFTFYMVTDPATTPMPARRQVGFGVAVAAVYAVLLASHIVFTPFFALTVVSAGRGALLWAASRRRAAAAASVPARSTATFPATAAVTLPPSAAVTVPANAAATVPAGVGAVAAGE